MNRFVQLHLLTSYPPANLNRDDLGRPKTAMMGGWMRLRISSQSLKRAWRTSDVFESALKGHIGLRTKEKGVEVFNKLMDKGVNRKKALKWAREIAKKFGKCKELPKADKKKIEQEWTEIEQVKIEQLAHFSPEEERLIDELIETIANGKEEPGAKLELLRKRHTAADIALFGRMLASAPLFNTEAAAQVAHAITVHSVAVENDYFTAVDDLNTGEEDAGAGHLGETEFAAGLFYLYLCIDKELLVQNLSDNKELADRTLAALIESSATVSPSGKQNSFASRSRASYILCEVGNQQPRSLSVAFLEPVRGQDMLSTAIGLIEDTFQKMDEVYGRCAEKRSSMNALTAEGSLQEIILCATEA